MNMKSRTLCGCVIALLLISTVAFGEIWRAGNWSGHDSLGDWTWTSATTHGGPLPYPWGIVSYGQGWEYTYTTVSEYLNWASYVYVWASVKMWLWNDERCSGLAHAEATADNPFGTDAVTAHVNFQDSGHHGEFVEQYDGELEIYSSYHKQFDAYEGVSCSHWATTSATAAPPGGGDSEVHSHADAMADGILTEFD